MSRPSLIPAETADWIKAGRTDIALWAERGLGIKLHPKQIEFCEAILRGEAAYYLLTWANRSGKTLALCVLHMHRLYYKLGLAVPRSDRELHLWEAESYRTLHCSPLNELAGRAWEAIGEIIKGTSPAQRDENGERRKPLLAQMFATTKERSETGADHILLRCLVGSVMDFRSTEGRAARLEGGDWYLITWDEWPSCENPDDIRFILEIRLTARAADHDAPIVLTGTITELTEHIAKEFIGYTQDPENADWWGNVAARSMNPNATVKSLERAERNLSQEDYDRSVLGVPGGVRGRMLPAWLIEPAFDPKLPIWQAPDKTIEAGNPKWTYLHVWDLAIASADNIGAVYRVPFDWKFSVENPLVGVSLKVIPGSHTLIDDEIVFAIEETYLPYGGVIWLDTTDAHGINVYRMLKRKGLPVKEFDFKALEQTRVTKKQRGIAAVRSIFAEGIDSEKDGSGEPVHDVDGILAHDRGKPYGAMRMPAKWTKPKDQLSILLPPPHDDRQKKDAAMVVLMACEIAFRERRGRTRVNRVQRAGYFARHSPTGLYAR
jgi:hypothetical protein